MKYGLLGKVLGHSFSKEIHSKFGNYSYELFERESDEIKKLLSDKKLRGLNITIPYKEELMDYCDLISPRAERIGCINTIFYDGDGRLIGDNTDYEGFAYTLDSLKLDKDGLKALILGDGATSKTVAAVLEDRGIDFVGLSRKKAPFYSDIDSYRDRNIIINTTSVGMYPNNLKSLVDLEDFTSLEAVIDVVYNPLLTKLLLDAKDLGIAYSGGLAMLVMQAAKSSELFTGEKIDERKIKEVIRGLSLDFGNIVLIGMPGSGKSSIARSLSKISGREPIDLDLEIERKAGMTIPDIFKIKGENYFRELESELVEEFGKRTGMIIATGGGVVTRGENYYPLKQNGRIYFIHREIENLSRGVRPLSTSLDRLKEMWLEREGLYQSFSDLKINNQGIVRTAEEIWGDYNENFAN